MNIRSAIEKGFKILENSNIKSAKLDAEILMSKVFKQDRSYIVFNYDKMINQTMFDEFIDLIYQRSNGKPIAYLIEKKDFWNSEFKVSEDVLIPRPDSEIIIEQTLRLTKNKSQMNILDIGIGSGCLLLSILKERKDFYGTGIDICKKSINLCSFNSNKLGLTKKVKLYKSDIDNFNSGKYDLILSNPPYINKFDLQNLEKDVIGFEPKKALYGGLDGTSEIRKVINKSSELIKINGKLILEIAFDQREKVKKLLKKKGFYINQIIKDLAHNDRCIISTKYN